MHRPLWIKITFVLCILYFIGGVLKLGSSVLTPVMLKFSSSTMEQSMEMMSKMDRSKLPPDLQMMDPSQYSETIEKVKAMSEDSNYFLYTLMTGILGILLGIGYLVGGIWLRRLELRGIFMLRMAVVLDLIISIMLIFVGKTVYASYMPTVGSVTAIAPIGFAMGIFWVIWKPMLVFFLTLIGDKSQLDPTV
jgi:MFS family permease